MITNPYIGQELRDARGKCRAVIERISGDKVWLSIKTYTWNLPLRFLSSSACGWRKA